MPPQPPPVQLIRSGFRPFILSFYFRLFLILQHIPGVILTSWWRSFDENVAAGGEAQSQHLFALAADLDVPAPLVSHTLELARQIGLIAVDGGDHVHVQLFPAGALAAAGVLFPEA